MPRKTTRQKEEVIGRILKNEVYMPDSAVVKHLRAKLIRLPLQTLNDLWLVLSNK